MLRLFLFIALNFMVLSCSLSHKKIDDRIPSSSQSGVSFLQEAIATNHSVSRFQDTRLVAFRFQDGGVSIYAPAQLELLSSDQLQEVTTIHPQKNATYYAFLFGTGSVGNMRILKLDTQDSTLLMYGADGESYPIKEVAYPERVDFHAAGISPVSPIGFSPGNFRSFDKLWPQLESDKLPPYYRGDKNPFLN